MLLGYINQQTITIFVWLSKAVFLLAAYAKNRSLFTSRGSEGERQGEGGITATGSFKNLRIRADLIYCLVLSFAPNNGTSRAIYSSLDSSLYNLEFFEQLHGNILQIINADRTKVTRQRERFNWAEATRLLDW